MAATFLVVPQWQGSGSSRAMRLVDGAEAIRGDLPSVATVTVDVPLGAGSDEGTTVQRLSSLQTVRDAQLAALATASGLAVTIGGDCGVELAAIEHANLSQDAMAVLWFDAHPDMNTPESSPSGAFTGMVLRTLIGEGTPTLVPAKPLEPSRTILVGIRNTDDGENEYLESSAVRALDAQDVSAKSIGEVLASSGATSVYVHIDLDVLDPSEFDGVGDPMPFGLPLATLLEAIAAAKAALPLAGAGITGFAPASPAAAGDDLGSILRIIGALSS
ncbi:arginase family protein [Glaciihabitans sp. UYNi722]|uniref:arginase family protein n=1 Tax=Glaciihabitans sp. UYNi722 TaxID=3156344 RepID=UPI003394AD63